MGGGPAVLFLLFVIFFALVTGIIIVFSQKRTTVGIRLFYAALTLCAPFIVLSLSSSLPRGMPSWIEYIIFIIVATSPYFARALFVFNHPKRKDVKHLS